MSFPLKDIELNIEDELVEKAELLIRDKKVSIPKEMEKNLWVTKIKDLVDWEVELQMSRKKVKAFTCDCNFYHNQQICEHIAAALLCLRKHLKKPATVSSKKTQPKKAPKKLTISAILQNIQHQELIQFVKQYARKDRQFAIALKVKFAGAVPFSDNKLKYQQLLDSSILTAQRSKYTLSKRGLDQILRILEELLHQAEQAIGLQFYRETLTICQVIIEKIPPLYKLAKEEDFSLKNVVKKAFEIIEQLPLLDIPPQLKQEIWDYAINSAENNPAIEFKLIKHYLHLLSSNAKEKAKVLQLLSLIDQILDHPDLGEKHKIKLIIQKLGLLEKTGQSHQSTSILETYLSTPEILLFAIKYAEQKKDWLRLKQLSKYGRSLRPPEDYMFHFDKIDLTIAQEENDKKNLVLIAKKLFLQTLDLRYYHIYKNNSNDPSEAVQHILSSLNNLPFSISKRDAIAAIYKLEGQKSNLLQYIESIRSLDLLLKYGVQIIEFDKAKAYELYRKVLFNYLQNHLGRQASLRVKQMILHLKESGAQDLAEELIDQFRVEYVDRHSLVEELGDL